MFKELKNDLPASIVVFFVAVPLCLGIALASGGGTTKMSAIVHGFFLLLSVITFASVLQLMPWASLAAILLMVGYTLAKPALFKEMYKLGWEQFVPFAATVVAILATDMLKGITVGMLLGGFYALHQSYRNSYQLRDVTTTEAGHEVHHIFLDEEVSFFNIPTVIPALDSIPVNSKVIIDCFNSKSIDYDVVEFI